MGLAPAGQSQTQKGIGEADLTGALAVANNPEVGGTLTILSKASSDTLSEAHDEMPRLLENIVLPL